MRMIRLAVVLAVLGLLSTGPVAAASRLPASELAPRGVALRGSDYRVQSPVPLVDHYGRYTVVTDYGQFDAWGNEQLAARIAEMPALRALDKASKSEAFADAIAGSLKRSGEAVAGIISAPVETVKALPMGLGRALARAARNARRAAVDIGDAVARQQGEADDAPPGAGQGEGGAKAMAFIDELAGVNQARRDLARALGIDPYTPNPLIQERLRGLAWATAIGGASLGLAIGQLSGDASDALSTSGRIHGLAWDRPPGELRDLLEARLKVLGVDGRTAREFLRSDGFSPSQQVRFVQALEAVGAVEGVAAAVEAAAKALGPLHPMFLVGQLEGMARLRGQEAVTALQVEDGVFVGRMRMGDVVMVLPVDRLEWSPDLDAEPSRRGDRPGLLIVTGDISADAARAVAKRGWRLRRA